MVKNKTEFMQRISTTTVSVRETRTQIDKLSKDTNSYNVCLLLLLLGRNKFSFHQQIYVRSSKRKVHLFLSLFLASRRRVKKKICQGTHNTLVVYFNY